MLLEPGNGHVRDYAEGWRRNLFWLIGFWVAPLWWISLAVFPLSHAGRFAVPAIGFALAPLPVLVLARRRQNRLTSQAHAAAEESARLKLQLESVRYRTAQLREELSAADRQARLSHQLSLLGQFTAGFMHEFNNPLAIVTSRIEVLLEERKEDAALSADLQQMLKETRYMGNIARTLLQALRRERGVGPFAASAPAESLGEALAALAPEVESRGVRIEMETPEVPRVDLPEHVVSEVVRALIGNALEALTGRENAAIWLRLEPYHTAGAKVILKVEDNGPGVPEGLREHLFEPFVSQSPGRERLGLGLFLAASLLDTYDGRLRYETRPGGGASFVVEMPPARFTLGPYDWFVGRSSL